MADPTSVMGRVRGHVDDPHDDDRIADNEEVLVVAGDLRALLELAEAVEDHAALQIAPFDRTQLLSWAHQKKAAGDRLRAARIRIRVTPRTFPAVPRRDAIHGGDTMTLADVCAGFGIQTVEITAEKWLACFISTDTHERSFILYGATDSDAACALLKARWGIHTWRQSSVGGEWFYAEHLRGAVMLIERERTELDAVAALARRLKETG